LVKRKWFGVDAATRREQHTFGVDVDLFEVTAPEPERGYVAFIPTADGNTSTTRRRCFASARSNTPRTRTVLPARENDLLRDMEAAATCWRPSLLDTALRRLAAATRS
jgi:hypothetical protein